MGIVTAYSTKGVVPEAVGEIRDRLAGCDSKMVLFFASSIYEPALLSQQMQEAFGTAVVLGCSTAGEIVSGRVLKNSIVAMSFDAEVLGDVKVAVVEDPGQESRVKEALDSFSAHYGVPMQEMDFEKYVGIVLVDGLSGAEERLMDTIGDLTNVIFVGGSAGDDLKFSTTYVYANGKAYSNVAALALLRPAVGFDIIKTQSFRALDRKLTATKVDEAHRAVIEFNHQPAAQAYATAVGTTVEDAPGRFMHNPVGLMVGDEPFVRSPQQVQELRMIFYCNVLEGMELSLLESTDIVRDTRQAIEDKKAQGKDILGLINFHCILRTLDLEERGLTAAYGNLFADIPTIGFSTYGEQYLGHINQTSTMLAFTADRRTS